MQGGWGPTYNFRDLFLHGFSIYFQLSTVETQGKKKCPNNKLGIIREVLINILDLCGMKPFFGKVNNGQGQGCSGSLELGGLQQGTSGSSL